jgi:hypothetical protein
MIEPNRMTVKQVMEFLKSGISKLRHYPVSVNCHLLDVSLSFESRRIV